MEKISVKRRVIAYLIDITLSVIASVFLLALLNIQIEVRFFKYFELLSIFQSIILFVYLFLFYMFGNGLSIGKIICNIRIVKDNNQNMELIDLFLRAFMQSLLILTVANVFFQLYTKSTVSLFDYTTNTKAVYRKIKK